MTSLAEPFQVDSEPRPLDRRVRRTQKAIRDAFISLVLERGYDHVLIEDIAQRADIGRATFYAHYSDKDDLFAQLFAGLSDELTAKMAGIDFSAEIRHFIIRTLYEEAAASRDLYRICLSGAGNGRARASYLNTVAEGASRLYAERSKSAGIEPRVPAEIVGQFIAGSHAALLHAWLEAEYPMPVEQAVMHHLKLLVNGYAWAIGAAADDYVTDDYVNDDSGAMKR